MKLLFTQKWLPLFVLLPIGLGLLWGGDLAENSYISLRYGQTLVAGQGFGYGMVVGKPPPLTSPLFVMLAALAAIWPIQGLAETAVWLISLTGWGCLGWVIGRLFADGQRPVAGLFTACAVLLNPYILTTLGSEISWALVCSWVIIGHIYQQKSSFLSYCLWIVVLLLIHFTIATMILALLLSLFFFKRNRFFFLLISLGWGVTAVYTREYAICLILTWVWVGLGLDELIRLIEAQNWSWLARPQLNVTVFGLLGLPLLFGQAVWLNNSYRTRPMAQWRQEKAVAQWLQADGNPTATLFATERIHYLTGQPLVATAVQPDDAFLQSLILSERPPDYLVFQDSADWLRITNEAWFEARYAPLQAFAISEWSEPLTIWGHRQSAFRLGQRQLAHVQAPAGLALVGYRAEDGLLVAEQTVQADLFLQLAQPLDQSLNIFLSLDSFPEGETLARNSLSIPAYSELLHQVFTRSLTLTLPADASYGVYRLTVAFQAHDGDEAGALWPLYQDNDKNVLDRASLGYFIVPWEAIPETAVPIMAQFGDTITLAAYEFIDSPDPEQMSDLVLYWQTSQLPDNHGEYLAFIHITNEAGELVVNLNERLADGTIPMQAWHPVGFIRDHHQVPLPPEMAAGHYQINVGLFAQDSGERMTIQDKDGQSVPDSSLPLLTFTVAP